MDEWEKKFKDLHKSDGAWRQDLYEYLGEDLRAIWGVTPDLAGDLGKVNGKVSVAIDGLLVDLPMNENSTATPHDSRLESIRASYNVLRTGRISGALEIRQNWHAQRISISYAVCRKFVGEFQKYATPKLKDQIDAYRKQHPQPSQHPPRSGNSFRWEWLAVPVALIVAAAIIALAIERRSDSSGTPKSQPLSISPKSRQGGAPAKSDAPFTVYMKYQHAGYCGFNYVANKNLADISTPPTSLQAPGDSVGRWANKESVADSPQTGFDLTITGKSEMPVVLTGMRVEVVSRSQQPPGLLVGTGCGDGITARFVGIDLDEQPPRALAQGTPEPWQSPERFEPVKFPYIVSNTKVEQFMVDAYTNKSNYQWRVYLQWSSGGRSGEYRVDWNGKPFDTASASLNATQITYDQKLKRWRYCHQGEPCFGFGFPVG